MVPKSNKPLRDAIYTRFNTQRTFSFAIGKSEAFVSDVIRGIKKPSAEFMKKACLLLGQQAEELFPNEYQQIEG